MNQHKSPLYLLIILHFVILIVAIVLLDRRFDFFAPVNSVPMDSVALNTQVPENTKTHSAENGVEKNETAEDTESPIITTISENSVTKIDTTTPFISICRINLHIRTAPSLSGKIIGRIPPRGTGLITERTNEEWVKIEYQNIVGYSFSNYLEFDPLFDIEESLTQETKVSEAKVSETKDIIVIRSACYVRNSAGNKNKQNIIQTAQKGDEFLHMATYDQPAWYAIAVEGQAIAYVSSKYAEIESRKTEE